MTAIDTRFDDTAIERVGTIVYSVTVLPDRTVTRGPWAICDHCGGVDLWVAFRVDSWGVTIVLSETDPHVCPPLGAPLPANSVCAARPCARCLTEGTPL